VSTESGAEPSADLTGGCLCGAVRFELARPPHEAGWCHCTRCQRRTGTVASASGAVDPADFHVVRGGGSIRAWRPPGGGFEKAFCVVCGAHLFSRDADPPTRLAVRLGAFDGDPQVRPSYRQFTDDAAVWEPLPQDRLKRYPGSRGAG
jgi:hypothetical protein